MQVAAPSSAVTEISLSEILMDTGIQCRAAINTETVSSYAERMTEADKFPPVDLFGAAGRFWIGDGWHRIMAARQIGAITISARVHAGGRQDALKHALGANASHGHRRTNADKRRCVEIAIAEFPALSSNAIAKLCGVHDGLVTETRRHVPESGTSTVTGTDGKQYPAKKKPKSEAVNVEPMAFKHGTPAVEKAEAVKALLATGHNMEQIAETLGITLPNVRSLVRRFDLAVIERKGRGTAKIDSAQVVRETVTMASAMCHGMRLVPKAGVDIAPSEAIALLAELREAMKTMKSLEQLLKRLSHEQG